MANNAFAFGLSPTHAQSMVDGESAIGPTADGAFAGGQLVYMARLFNLADGAYTFKFVADDACTVWLGSDAASAARVGQTAMYQQGSSEAAVYVNGGQVRVDVIVHNSAAVPLSPVYFALSIRKDGRLVYTSSTADGWKWATAPIPDQDLPSPGDIRKLLPVFTLSPNWISGVLERISFNTEVFTSETGEETRRALRLFPRRSLEASFLRTGTHRQRLDNFVNGVGKGKFLCPIWMEDHRLRQPLGTAGVNVYFDAETLKYKEFAPGDLCLLMGNNPDVYEIVEILTVNTDADVIDLVAPPLANWPAGSRLLPLRIARMMQLPQLSNITDRVGAMTLRVDFEGTEKNFGASWGYCAPLWGFKIDRADRVNLAYQRQTFEFDSGTTDIVVTDPGDMAKVVTSVGLKLFGASRVAAYRAFISIARGRRTRFWMPSQLHDIEPLSEIGGATLMARPSGYADFMTRPQDSRVMIAITYKDGGPATYRKIVNIESVNASTAPFRPAYEMFTLDTPLPPAQRDEIERVSFVLPVRFDQDSFEIRHHVTNGRAASAAAVMMSADSTDMPDLNCWLTSTVYPLLAVDAIDAGLTFAGSSFGVSANDWLNIGTSVDHVEILHPLKTTDQGSEGVNFGMGVDDVEMITYIIVYVTLDQGVEGINLGTAVVDGDMMRKLIETTVTPHEAINIGMSFNAGSMS